MYNGLKCYTVKLRRQADTIRAESFLPSGSFSVCGTARCFRLPLWHLFGISAGASVPAYRSYRNVRVHSSELRHPKNLNSTAASVNGATENKLRSSMRYMSDFYTSTAWKNKREAILSRDGYMCRNCKRYGRQRPATTVHHIKHFDEYPELALESDNLISLCEACHNLMHPEKAKKSNKSRGNHRYF